MNGPAIARGAAARHVWKLAPGWLIAATVPVASIGIILITDTRWLGSTELTAALRTRLVGQMLLTEAALLVICAPLAGLFTAMRVKPSREGLAGNSAAARLLLSAWQLGRPLVTRITVMTATSAVIAFTMLTTMDANTWLRSHAILWAAALALAALGAACAPMFREPLDAAACAIGVALLGTIALFAGGPALDSIPRWLLDAALVVNPLVATAASANVDLFRMDLLYQLSPLAHRHVEYPALSTALAAYVLIAVALLLLTARQFTSRVTMFSVERTSS